MGKKIGEHTEASLPDRVQTIQPLDCVSWCVYRACKPCLAVAPGAAPCPPPSWRPLGRWLRSVGPPWSWEWSWSSARWKKLSTSSGLTFIPCLPPASPPHHYRSHNILPQWHAESAPFSPPAVSFDGWLLDPTFLLYLSLAVFLKGQIRYYNNSIFIQELLKNRDLIFPINHSEHLSSLAQEDGVRAGNWLVVNFLQALYK